MGANSSSLHDHWDNIMSAGNAIGNNSLYSLFTYHNRPTWLPNVTYYNGENDPDAELDQSADASLRRRSCCPWYHVINTNDTRYPRVLVEARCTTPSGPPDDFLQTSSGSVACEEVRILVPVLVGDRAHCEQDKYVWTHDWEEIVVGCTCAFVPQ